jgi:hypothetical protein
LLTAPPPGTRLGRAFIDPDASAAMFAGRFLPSAIEIDAVRLALLWRERAAPQPSSPRRCAARGICATRSSVADQPTRAARAAL